MWVVIACAALGGSIGAAFYAHDTVYEYAITLETGKGDPEPLQYGVWPELANADFFTTVRDRMVAERVTFVEANLTTMSLRVYRDGAPVLTVPVKSKGREGSWWETPSGLYKAQGKEKEHFSSFGQVYMPWSIPFQGNFFIHGWPRYPDGTPVAEGYSGGCIRLENEYAAEVYALVEVGMPILVFEESTAKKPFSYTLAVPSVDAASYLVADLESNFVLLANGADTAHPTELLTPLLAALVASEHRNIEQRLTVTEATDDQRITKGSSYSIYDLLFPLLLEGSPDAVEAIARSFGVGRFDTLMREKAAAIGMQHTVPGGVGEGVGTDETTPEDLFTFLKYLHTNRPFILSMTAGSVDTRTYGAPVFSGVAPRHPFRNDDTFRGGAVSRSSGSGSVGSEAAVALAFATSSARRLTGGEDMLTVFSLLFNGAERDVAFIVLGSHDPAGDTKKMVAFVKQLYQ